MQVVFVDQYCKYGLMVIDTCYSSGEININAGGICGANGLKIN